MKKELWIVNHYATPPGYGGLTRHYYLAKYLQKLGYDVKIFASSAIHNSSFNFIKKEDKEIYKETIIDGVKYVHIKTSQYKGNKFGRVKNIIEYYFRTPKVLKKYLKKSKPDYIYSSTPHPLSPLIANKFAKKNHIKSIVETRDLWPYSLYAYQIVKSQKNLIYLILKYLEKKIYSNATKLVFTMDGAIEYLKSLKYYDRISDKKIFILPNGIDFEELEKNYKDYQLKDKDLDDKTFKVVYAGSLRYTYNISMLVDIAYKMKNEKRIKFLVYGKGPEEESLKQLISRKKLNNIIIKGFVDNKYLPFILSKCDLALIHGKESDISKYGMSTNKEVLYLSSKLPVVNCYINGKDPYKKNKCGITLSNYSVQDYNDKILYIYNLSNKEKNEYKENAYCYSKKFDYKNITKKLKDILED